MRALDHCVLPVADLGTARNRLSALGFQVAHDALHPFGTQNACVFFGDNTYLEPLAIGDRTACEEAATRGNEFIRRDLAYRFRRGEDGFSAIVFKSDDADADHKEFCSLGLSAGQILGFSRPVADLDGNKDIAEFKLAFAADLRSPDMLFFTCERVRSPAVDRSSLQNHANGVKGISEVILSEVAPDDFVGFLEALTKSKGKADIGSWNFDAGRTTVTALDHERLKAGFACKGVHARGLRARALVFSVPDTDKVAKLLEGNGVAFSWLLDRIVVQPESGQGAVFAFEQD